VDSATKAFLRHQKRPNTFHAKPQPLNFEKLTEGFKKWPEKTSTSPSGRHLGIYKSLLKDVHRKKDKDGNNSQSSTQSDSDKRRGVDVMTLVYQILQLAVTHTHTLQRWCTIWNLFLEKDPGQPKINRLRALHLLEADLNLLWKYYSAQGFFKTAENNDLLIDNQGGCRKGFSAIDMACKKALVYEWMRLMRATGINIDNDLEACFDNMVEACHSLACQSKGADIQYLRLHAQTQKLQKYFVKHAQGISKDHNTFSPEAPWYGAGQGTGDAALRYTTQSDGMIRAYRDTSWNLEMTNPTNSTTATQDIDAYADDTTLMNGIPNDNQALLRLRAQQNLTNWSNIVKCTGGALNPPKCGWAYFRWNFNTHGQPNLSKVQHPVGLQLPDRKGHMHQLQQHLPTKAVRLLGVHIAMDGNMDKEYQILKEKAAKYKQVLYRCKFTTTEAKTIYRQCYIPALSYPLPATSMDPVKIQETQNQVTALFLSNMGYSRLFPRSVAFASATIGGIGLRHFGFEQDVQKVISLLKHGRAQTHHWPIMQCLLESYQLYAGIRKPILEDTGPLPWCPEGWVTSLRHFLFQIQGQILLNTTWSVPERRLGDRHIMDDARSLHLSRTEYIDMNNVRLFLRINMLSEITDHTGHRILSTFYTQPDNNAQNQNPSGSTLRWPQQTCPGKRAWQAWKHALQQLYLKSPSLDLRHPLGTWYKEHVDTEWQWNWKICPTTRKLYRRQGQRWSSYAPIHQARTSVQYEQPDNQVTSPPTKAIPVTAAISRQNKILIQLPLTHISTTQTLQEPPPTYLITKLTTPPTKWERPLWHTIQHQQDIWTLAEDLTRGIPIILSTDAAMNAAKRSCFAWTIYSTTNLWQGSGAVPGHYEDAHSTRSEAYGILTMLRFLMHYVTHFPLVWNRAHPIRLYCDNNGILQRIRPPTTKEPPKITILNDYDVVAEIKRTLQALAPLKIELHHIKGHQDDKTATHDLSLPATLNIECDSRANRELPLLQDYSIFTPHPKFPSAYPYLQINNRNIVRDLAETLRHAATSPDYREYLQEKHDWTQSDSYEVNWNAIKLAMKHVKPTERRNLQKFLHDWLPYRASHRRGDVSHDETLCPSCQHAPENYWHFLECGNQKREQLFQSLLKDLKQMHIKQNLNLTLYYMLQAGLLSVRQATEIPHAEENFQGLEELHHRQSRLGWEQLFYGRISVTWAHYIDDHSDGNTNGTIFYSRIIRRIWRYALDAWTSRNLDLHERNPDLDRPALAAQVQNLIHLANQDPTLQHMTRSDTPDNILNRPIAQVQQWIETVSLHIRHHLAAAQQRAALHTRDIRSFFPTMNIYHRHNYKPP